MRTKNTLKNVFTKWVGIFLLTIFQFISRKIFIVYYSDELMGLAGLLNSVISMLSLFELGIGTAIYYSLYKPLAKNDYEMTAAIMRMYKKVYFCIGCTVFVVGILLTNFLDLFISTELERNIVIKAYYILLADTVASYLLSHRRNIFNADQKEYVCNNVDTIIGIGGILSQIIVTVLLNNYYLYLAAKIIWTIGGNIFIYFKSNKKYPYINNSVNIKLPKEYLDEFKGNVKALCVGNISSYLVFGTDNLLLSKFAGLSSVFLYSNYNIIISTVNKLFHNIFFSMQASVGNKIVSDDKKSVYGLFEGIQLLNYFVTCFTTIAMFLMFNDFIEIWLGKQYIWPISVVFIVVLNNYLRFIMQTTAVFRNAAGIYNPYPFYKFWGIIEGALNLTSSLLFIILLNNNVLAVFLGTTISTILYSLVSTKTLFSYYFSMMELKEFFKKYIVYALLTGFYLIIGYRIVQYFRTNMIFINLLIDVVVAVMIPNIFNIIIFRNTKGFIFLKNKITTLLKK